MVSLKGTLQVPGDKSISHRALIFAALSRGVCKVYGLSPAFDCISSADCLKQLGLKFERRSPSGNGLRETVFLVTSPGLDGLHRSDAPLFAGNSGTTIRLISGLVAAHPFKTVFDGDDSLRARPMSRVLRHLGEMGASIHYLQRENYAPFEIEGAMLTGKTFDLDVASAQVQTAILLAGLQADGTTRVKLPTAVRDHTARMFKHIGVPMEQVSDNEISVKRLDEPIEPFTVNIPADISSAAFFMVAAACLPGSNVLLNNVVINPGRDLVISVLQEMGADIEVGNQRERSGELIADIAVRGDRTLGSVSIDGTRLAAGIDEIPIIAIAAAMSQGTFQLTDASELRVKESDRLAAIVGNLRACGAAIEESDDGFVIEGKGGLKGGAEWKSYDDHRMAMSGIIAGLLAEQIVRVDNESCIAVSYPDFINDLRRLTAV